ncbi:MAG: hypothetical protein L0287_13005 [Anaerolineae bacterium]|nr:hypothetical protein [Anaerolineae bacterium]
MTFALRASTPAAKPPKRKGENDQNSNYESYNLDRVSQKSDRIRYAVSISISLGDLRGTTHDVPPAWQTYFLLTFIPFAI